MLSLSKLLSNGIKIQPKEESPEEKDEEDIAEEPEKICSLWSSLLTQAILVQFIPIPNSINKIFTTTGSAEIVKLSADAKASRLIEAFLKSANVPDEVKTRFVGDLTAEHLVDMACSCFGSRVMDSVWDSANRQLIDAVKDKLESQRTTLKCHKIGRFVESKFFGYIPKMQKDNKAKKNSSQNNGSQKQAGANSKREALPSSTMGPQQKKPKIK